MRAAALCLVILAGCGRLGFDPLGVTGDGGSEVVDAPDAAPGTTLYMVNSDLAGPTVLYQLDVVSGEATSLGIVAPGRITAMMRRDANTLLAFAYDDGEIREITLSPLSSQTLGFVATGYVGMTDVTASTLIAINENDDLVYEIPYANLGLQNSLGRATDAVTTTPIDVNGGALTTYNNVQYLWTNGVRGLYTVNGNMMTSQLAMTTGIPTYIPGIAFLNGTLWAISRDTDEVFSIDVPSGTVTARTLLSLDIDNADLVP